MSRRAILSLAFAGLSVAAGADPPAATVQDVVYFASSGPARARLRITVNGQPADAAWQAAVDRLFAFCDRDGNGTLDAKERAVFTTPARRSGSTAIVDEEGNPVALAGPQVFNEKDAPADKATFAAKLRAAGLGPVVVSTQPGSGDTARLTEALFRHLDRDGDGQVSTGEASAATQRFAALDLNEDDLIAADELLGTAIAANPNRVVRLPGRREAPAEPRPDNDLLVLPAGSAAVKEVLKARDGDRSGSLSRAEFGADAKTFAALDKDGNAQLDTDELAAWLRQPPDLELEIAFDDKPAAPSQAMPLADARVTLVADRRAAKALADGWNRTAAMVQTEFDNLAKGKKAIERKQLEGNREARGLLPVFDLADRNDDKILTRDERELALAAVGATAACRVEITIVDGGRGLFELLDRNGDGQLSPREMMGTVDVVKSIDRNGDGRVGRDEVPRLFSVSAAPAAISLFAQPRQQFVATGMEATGPRPPSADVPAWFARMDRNGDGDVSRREFLGPTELFRKLDLDGDGLLSADEAKAVK